MNKEEIMEMDTDQLDIAVGEVINGWTRIKREHPVGDCLHTWFFNPSDMYAINCQCLFAPSTDISKAWEIVEKMQEQGLAKDFTLYWGDGWWCFFAYRNVVGNSIYAIQAETAPEAICKAALIAKLEV